MTDQPSPARLAFAGAVSLGAGVGIGRFAFTPILPMMLADGSIDLQPASWLATANYAGYLVGALLCTFAPWLAARSPRLPRWQPTRWIRAGLLATGVLTLAMAGSWSATWPTLRFLAGVVSAVVFVHTSGWCLAQLTRRGAGALGGAMYAGPGAGIIVSGLLASAMVTAHWRAASAWLLFGLLALVLTATVWRVFRMDVPSPRLPSVTAATPVHAPVLGPVGAPVGVPVGAEAGAPVRDEGGAPLGARIGAPVGTAAGASPPLLAATSASCLPAVGGSSMEVAVLAAAYGLAGFGYIITATFLPVIARQALPGSSPLLDFFWPLFGLGVMVGALLASRLRTPADWRSLLAASYALQALAIGLSLWSPSPLGLAIGSFLLGVPFTAITFFALQEVRRLRPHSAPSAIGLMTALYGIGQIAGPAVVAWLLRISDSPAAAFTTSLQTAAAALVTGSVMYVTMSRIYPAPRP